MAEAYKATIHSREQAKFKLQEAFAWIKPLVDEGHRLTVVIKPESKTREQEEKYHAMIGEVAEQAQHLGSTWQAEDWKRLLLDKFARETGRTHGKVIPNLDKTGVVEVGILSRKFNKVDGAEFIEWLYAWGIENGVTYKDGATERDERLAA